MILWEVDMSTAKTFEIGAIGAHFESLSDPRHPRNVKHQLVDIIVIAVCAIVSHAAGPTAIHLWAKARESWLRQFLPLPHGIPSRDCIRRTLIALQPEAFQECFQSWLLTIVGHDEHGQRRLIAIDGKCCRGSHDDAQQLGPLQIVSAWASECGMALGQVAAADKSNEITAIPLVLERLDLAHSLVTIDAIGCQKEIVAQIHHGRGAYAIAVKANQPTLHQAVIELIGDQLDEVRDDLRYQVYETLETGHGRVDERSYGVVQVPRDWSLRQDWPSVRAVGYATRVTIAADGTESFDTRYYILNRKLTAKYFGEAVRSHWSIEAMHWVLDVVFREDAQQTVERTLVNNLSWLRRFAVTLLKRGLDPKKMSIRGRMQMAGWNTDHLEQVLLGT